MAKKRTTKTDRVAEIEANNTYNTIDIRRIGGIPTVS